MRWEASSSIAQGAFVRLMDVFKEYTPATNADFAKLVAEVMRLELISLTRKHFNRTYHEETLDTDKAQLIDSDNEVEKWENLHAAVDKLPDPDKQVVNLLFYHGMTRQEAATFLGISMSTVSRRWQSARLRLAKSVLPSLTATERIPEVLPTVIGEYKLANIIGRGGSGIVFRAYKADNPDKMVALKILHSDLVVRQKVRDMFLREVQALSRVQHQNVITVHESKEIDSIPYLVMPLLSGESLEARLAKIPLLPIMQIKKIAKELAEALEAVHKVGLIHRDVKPSNIWLEGDPFSADYESQLKRVLLLDFGLASNLYPSLEPDANLLGSLGYMAPEQLHGAREIGADWFSFGAILYRMITGQPAFSGITASALISATLSHQPPTPSELNPKVPTELSTYIMRLLSKDPALRPKSTKELSDALLAMVQSELKPIAVDQTTEIASRNDSIKQKEETREAKTKTDDFLYLEFESIPEKGFESTATRLPMLIRIKDTTSWRPPSDFETHSQVGHIISGAGTAKSVRAMEEDENVLSIEASRSAGHFECDRSIPFINATKVHSGAGNEKGDHAIVALIDSGIDVLHKAFIDDQGKTRILAIWDQNDSTGPTPKSIYPSLQAAYGSIHTAEDINEYIKTSTVPARLGRDPSKHGTHVASIAAGRTAGLFHGGVAPEAKLALVIPRLITGPNDPTSIGYSRSHVDALAYFKRLSTIFRTPLVVNVSLGMNAGAHDGTSLLEAAFDEFSSGGREPGLVVIKSAGNERSMGGHAKLTLPSKAIDTLRWQATNELREQDVFEIWFTATDEVKFRLRDPVRNETLWCGWDSVPRVQGKFPSGNAYALSYTNYHHDNGDSRLLLLVKRGDANGVVPGVWELEVESGIMKSNGVIHAWVERTASRPVRFITHHDDHVTLSIPGTAETVITVAAVNSELPLQNTNTSSFGLTRIGKCKPDVCAPGTAVIAALAGTDSEVVAMSGTSMAAPHVTGAVALLLSSRAKVTTDENPLPNANQIRSALCKGTRFYGGHHTPSHGYGLVDVEALLKAFNL